MDKIINDEDGEITPRWSLKVKGGRFISFPFPSLFPHPKCPSFITGTFTKVTQAETRNHHACGLLMRGRPRDVRGELVQHNIIDRLQNWTAISNVLVCDQLNCALDHK